MLRNNPGLTPRVLAFRLRELREAGLLERIPGASAREVGYRLTAKGQDVVPILTAFIEFGARHLADEVFEDGRPRTLQELFPGARAARLGPGGRLRDGRA
ncbi:MAG: winged helix-turn-helix transcriptional regulator [Halobacteriales archaeon]|nr:winged helix-turn-helix transcriptional regulator [Halobacteriales archaeon]